LRAFTIFVLIKKELKEHQEFDPAFVFLICMLRITPALILKSVKYGGTSYLIPFPVSY
jgi:ribosomal protein S7